jgi:uncharacterized protein (TIGR03382 family)
MGYVQAGYTVVLSLLALYAGSLVVRRRRLERTLERVEAAERTPGDPA